ncbi:MAG: PSD1 and planctomycete cytochrome C domain-containing protein [Planctomycetes bacterium]|nr:PSD1 and planctomycete cytochrome C domain-containing protein [Planctomycetota bacterium]
MILRQPSALAPASQYAVRLPTLLAAALSFLLQSAAAFAETPEPATPPRAGDGPTFEDDVVPVLAARCFKCHGSEVRKAGLDLRRRFSIVKGGDSGAALLPGKPDESLLVEMVRSKLMPPEGETPLTAKELQMLVDWIAAGAAIKGDTEPPLEADDVRLSPDDRNFWAFQPPARPPVPTPAFPPLTKGGPGGGAEHHSTTIENHPRTPIDAFLLSRLHKAGGTFNPEAPRETLIRRLYFDLVGLPPTPEEIGEFLADDRPDAYERLVDRLLASPRYGERWGRHWLDVAGYADSDGYLEADRLRPEAWRYRDYVIRALNADKPYDRFVLEQMAGDELVDWRRAPELTPEMAECLTATGFLRTALDPTYGNYAEPLECYKVMADTVQIVSSAFLGLTVQCARCHAHKFDPLSHRDYYRLHAVFLASYDPDRWQVSAARHIPLASEAEQARITAHNAQVDARLAQLNAAIAELTQRFRDKYLDEKLAGIEDEAVRTKVREALLTDEKNRSAEQKQLLAEQAAGIEPSEEQIGGRFPVYRDELQRLRVAVEAETALKQPVVELRGLIDLESPPSPAHVLIRGDFHQRGAAVEPGIPEVLAPAGFELNVAAGYKTSGRRLALARWLVDRQNPLTARVEVNRIWAHHFGRGLVTTLDNFGLAGARPSHPELLDWLAVEFVGSPRVATRGLAWSRKRLHRLMLTSTAWRQSAQPAEWQQTADPENAFLGSWRPARHEGEVVRDAMLFAAGRLNRKMYGPPVAVTRHSDGLVTVADGPGSNRASVYLIVRRSQPVTLLELFDTPTMEVNCPERTESAVVTQSLTMLNSGFVETTARALAARLFAEASDDTVRLDLAWRLLYGRRPSETERAAATEFLDQTAGSSDETARRTAWEQLAIVLFNANEFLYAH